MTVTVIASGGVTAVDDAVTAVAGRTTTINVLDNDLNASLSGSAATVVTLLSQPPAAEGAASVTGQSIAFTPAAGFTGSTSFRYRAVNPTSLGNIGSEATVTVSVVGLGGTVISDSVTDPELIRAAQSFEQSCVIVRDSGALDTQSQQFLDVCTNLTTAAANSEDLTQAMQALRNEEHFAAVDATATVARGLGRIVSRRLTQIRDGAARGFNTSAITFRIGDEVIPNELVENAVGGLLGLRKNVFDNPNWGLFIAGDIAWVERGSGDTNSGYELQANNLMIGYDQILDERSSLGLAFGYSNSSTDFSGGGELKSTGYQLTVYGVQKDFLRQDLTFEGFLSVGRMEFSSDRRINFSNGGSTVDTFANAEFNGTYINAVPKLSYARVLGDYNDPIGALRTATRLTWSASLDYLWMNLDDYRETGGDGLGLDVQSETYESLILAFGLDASRPVYYGPDTRAEVYGGLEIRGELLDRDRSVSSAFATAGPNAPRFLVNEEGTYGLGAGFEIGTLFSFGTGGQVDLNYGYERAGGNLTTQYLSLGYSTEVVGQDSFSVNVTRDVSTARDSQMSATVDYRFRF